MSKIGKNKKLIAVFLVAVLILIFVAPPIVNADTKISISFIGCAENPVTCAVYGVTYIINSFLAFLVALGAWTTKLALRFSEGATTAPAVTAGFGVSLAVANLGFVLAIIIIAIATILRSQTYGLKKILLKLIFAAILVNFSLVIARGIVGFADNITDFFLQAASPNASDVAQLNSNFVDAITQSFAPQALFSQPDSSAPQPTLLQDVGTIAKAIGYLINPFLMHDLTHQNPTDNFSQFIQVILNLLFSSIFLLLSAISFFVITIMLLIRYAFLGVLLILMPFAWLLWIFPNFKSNWDKWWHNFLRWTFFAPIMIFFLYLAVLTSRSSTFISNIANGPAIEPPGSPSGSAAQALTTMMGNNPNLLGVAGQMIIILTLVFGGLFAANALSITGAGEAIKMVKGAGGKIGDWAGKRGKQLGTAPLRTEGTRAWANKLQQSKFFGARWLGRGVETLGVAGGERSIAQYKSGMGKLTDDQVLNRTLSRNAMERWAALQEAAGRKLHDDNRFQTAIGKERGAEAGRYGQGQFFKEARVASGLDLMDKRKAWADAPADQKAEKRRGLSEAVAKLATTNPELLAKQFSSDVAIRKMEQDLARRSLSLPPTLRPENTAAGRQAILGAFGHLSPSGAGGLLSELSKQNNLGNFGKAITEMKKTNHEDFVALRKTIMANAPTLRYLSRNAAQGMGFSVYEAFDIERPQRRKKEASAGEETSPTAPKPGPGGYSAPSATS